MSASRYKLLKRLAVGGMAEIFLASVEGEAGFERKVIIKKILPHRAGEPEFVRRLVDEGLLAARLHHSNIVQVLDLGRIGPDYFIAMEFVDGVDLRHILATAGAKHFAIPVPIGTYILWQVARALSYAHNKTNSKGEPLGIIHRDVSPSNVFISWEGAVKLGDFGIAKANQRLSTQTMTGVLQGKFSYMSPEQADGLSLDQRSDIFSFGCVAYEVLTGQRPFKGESDLQVLARIREGTFTPARKVRADLPEDLEEVVHTCLQKDPKQRYPHGEPLERALAGVMQKQRFVVTERDLADFLTVLYGPEKRSLVQELEGALPTEARIVEASPLDPVLLKAGLPITGGVREDAPFAPDGTRSVISPSWNARQKRSHWTWMVWIIAMMAVSTLMLLDYFAFNVFLGNPRGSESSSRVAVVGKAGPSDATEGMTGKGPEEEMALFPQVESRPAEVKEQSKSGETNTLPARVTNVKPDSVPLPGGTTGQEDLGSYRAGLSYPQRVESLAPDVSAPGRGSIDSPLYSDVPRLDNPIESAGKNSTTTPAARRSVTRVTAIPLDTLVFVDGKLLGVQPQRVSSREGGAPRRVKLERQGYRGVQFELKYPAPRIVAKKLEPVAMGRLALRYFPASATVLVDGKVVPQTSGLNIIEMDLVEGDHEVVVKGEDIEVNRKVHIKGGAEWRGTITAVKGGAD